MARAGRNVYLVRCLQPFLLLALYLADGCHGIQRFEETPRYTEVNPGQDAKLSCRVSDKRGQCIWQKDNKPIGMLMKKYEWAASPDTGDCSLWIRSAALDFDDGSWQCQVSLSDFTTQDALTSEPARLVVRVSPQRPQIEFHEIVVPPGNNVTARAGEVARPLSCVSRYGNPPALLKWYLGDTEVPSLGPQVNTTEETNPRTWAARSFAEILAERRLYGQRIRCVALHAAYGNPGASLGTEVRFDVRYAPETRIVGAPPSGEVHLEEDRDQLAVRCVADANPPAMIRWRREGIVSGGYAGPGNDIAPTAGEALFASPVRRTHAGRYSCVATNTVGESVPIAVHVSVDYPPRISSVGPDRLTTALLYTGASFECLADAVPPPEYRWLQIFADGREPLARGGGHRLLLSNVSYEQQGRYVCVARNEIDGRVREARSEPVSLQVVGAPRVTRPSRSESVSVVSAIEGDPARLEITLCSDPRPRLVAWEWGSVRLHAGEILDSRYRALDLEPLATLEDCYAAVLELTTAFKEDQRLYNVVVENDRGSDRCALMLRVTEPGQIPLVVGAVAGFTVLSILIMGFACFLRTDKCCFVRPEEGPGPLQAPPRGNKANVGITDETRSSGVETMERATRRYAQQKQPIDAPLKPHASPQYRQHPPSYDPDHPQQLQQQRQHPRHLHGRQQQIVHGPQCEIQIRRDISTGNEPAILQW